MSVRTGRRMKEERSIQNRVGEDDDVDYDEDEWRK